MELKRRFEIQPMWRNVSLFIAVMFFVFLADGMLSDFVPGFIQGYLKSPLFMGIVMSTSSVAGIVLDLSFARMLRHMTVGKMIALAFAGCIGFAGMLYAITYVPWVAIMVAAMVTWGFYYEFFGFSSQKFVVGIASPQHRTAVWSVMETVRAIAYAAGPILMAFLTGYSERRALISVAVMLTVGFYFFTRIKLSYKPEREVEHSQITIWHELKHWKALFGSIWPMAVMGVTITLVDAVYWTTGTVVNDQLAEIHPLGGLFITIYMLSTLVVGAVYGRKEIKEGKKKKAELFLLGSGLVLAGMTLFQVWWWYLMIVFVSSVLSALAWPLIDAVYTDLLSRMGKEQHHMIGLKNASNSIAYIIGPILAGLFAGRVGEIESFVYLGLLLITIAALLLVTTPRKLRLPQKEIRTWE